jgi:hypothetical protein
MPKMIMSDMSLVFEMFPFSEEQRIPERILIPRELDFFTDTYSLRSSGLL